MKINLQMEFQSLDELKAYLDVQKTCTCKTLAPTVPETTTCGEPQITLNGGAPESVGVFPPQEEAITVAAQEPSTASAEAADTTAEPVSTPTTAPTPAVSTAAVSYTLDDLCRAGMNLVDAGKRDDLPPLLKEFGVTSLPELPQDQYSAFALRLREMGAAI